MSSLPDVQSPGRPRALPLGRLLIERGLLTEQQLIEGLLEQDRTGDRLGKVLIRLGYVDAPSVAMALASQHGGPLKTEYGFATGFPAVSIAPVMDDEPDLIANGSLTRTEPSASPGHDAVAPERSAVSAEPPERENVTELSPTAPSATATALATASDQHPSATIPAPAVNGAAEAEHDRAPSQIVATITEPDAAQAELEAAHARIADLERELAVVREQLDERRSRTAELQDEVAGARLAAETAIAALRGVAEAAP